jgi:hypothetical protein
MRFNWTLKLAFLLLLSLGCKLNFVAAQSDAHFTPNHLIEFFYKSKIGYMNVHGKVILQPVYGGLSDTFRDGYLVVAGLGDKPQYALANHLGEIVIPFSKAKLINLGKGIIMEQNAELKMQRLYKANTGFVFTAVGDNVRLNYDAELDRILVYKSQVPQDNRFLISVFEKDSTLVFSVLSFVLEKLTNIDSHGIEHELPYYRTGKNRLDWSNYSILNLGGALLFDSVMVSYPFLRGHALLRKGREAVAVDLDFMVLDSGVYKNENIVAFSPFIDSSQLFFMRKFMAEHLGQRQRHYFVDPIEPFINGRAIRSKDSIPDLILDGDVIIYMPSIQNMGVKLITDFKDGYGIVMRDGKYGLISSEGKLILPCRYDSIAVSSSIEANAYGQMFHGRVPFLNDGFIVVTLKNKDGLINVKTGKYVLLPEYEDIQIGYYRKHYFLIKNRKLGLCALNGDMIIPVVYDNVSRSRLKGNFGIWKDDIIGLANSEGKVYWPKLK